MTSGQVNRISYAIDSLPDNDPYITLSNSANIIGVEGGEPWKYMVVRATIFHFIELQIYIMVQNVMPWLDKVPDWVPGTGWKVTKRKWQALTADVLAKPFEKTRSDLVCQHACEKHQCLIIVSRLLEFIERHLSEVALTR